MKPQPRIAFSYRRVADISDVTDLVAFLFPGNRNQQHAAARVLLELKPSTAELTPSLSGLQQEHGISRRTLERVRAKLSNLGLIERVSWMSQRYGGRSGWRLSSRMPSALRRWANMIDSWRGDRCPERFAKDEQLVNLLR